MTYEDALESLLERACGSADTDTLHHELLTYSAGITETVELRCHVCRYYTVVDFET